MEKFLKAENFQGILDLIFGSDEGNRSEFISRELKKVDWTITKMVKGDDDTFVRVIATVDKGWSSGNPFPDIGIRPTQLTVMSREVVLREEGTEREISISEVWSGFSPGRSFVAWQSKNCFLEEVKEEEEEVEEEIGQSIDPKKVRIHNQILHGSWQRDVQRLVDYLEKFLGVQAQDTEYYPSEKAQVLADGALEVWVHSLLLERQGRGKVLRVPKGEWSFK